jgi:hypothetical protein
MPCVQIGKRGEEARDMARYALRNPWWSLAHFDATRAVSELQGDAQQVHWQLSAEATEASTSQVTGFQYKEPRTEQEVRSRLRLCCGAVCCDVVAAAAAAALWAVAG